MKLRATMGVVAALALAAAALAPADSAAAAGAAPDCPAPFPVGDVVAGMTGWGLTVSRGTTPERFDVKVEGVLRDGIAPGIDLIIVTTEAQEIDRVGGIWEGMSGSPVYAPDGRILGAISYGFSNGPSKLAGITPAAAMLDELGRPGAAAKSKAKMAAGRHAVLPQALRHKVVADGAATTAQAAQGLAPLPTPLAVSGLGGARLTRLNAELGRRGSEVRMYAASSAAGTAAPAGAIKPGGNFAAMQTYGDLSVGGVGTTTMVCAGQALAFGHPFTQRGPVRMSAHDADAVTIVDDPAGPPYKMANIGGVAGTLTQDRTTAIAARLGAGPAGTTATSTVTADGVTRTGSSVVNMTEDVPGGAGLHFSTDIDRVFDRIGGGSATVTFTVKGSAGGKSFTLSRSNRFADTLDVGYLATSELTAELSTIEQNPTAAVKFTSVTANAALDNNYGAYTVNKVYAKPGKKWVLLNPDNTLSVKAGQKLPVRATLTSYRAAARTISVTLTVPKNRKGRSGTLNVAGGNTVYPGDPALCLFFGADACVMDLHSTSVAGLVQRMRKLPRNDDLTTSLVFSGGGNSTTTKTSRLDKVVNNADPESDGLSIPISVR
ncbi:MAG TPA: SpoIVB peptidase S55 domain-containing protein [Streptosporangiaceae bacterium]